MTQCVRWGKKVFDLIPDRSVRFFSGIQFLKSTIGKQAIRSSGKTLKTFEPEKNSPIKQVRYSMWMASEGQASTQVWQSTHMSLSTFAFSFSIQIADAGHSFTQVSHPVHFSLSTTATKTVHFQYTYFSKYKKSVSI